MNNIKSRRIQLTFAELKDRKKIFDMLLSQEVYEYMFDKDHPAPSWEEFLEEGASYYTGRPNKDGSYLLIEFDKQIIGSISYDCGYEKIPYAELDIWLCQKKFLGRGLGTEAIQTLVQFLNTTYQIRDFIIRPWIKNVNAIKAYKKLGFHESSHSKIEDYYSEENMDLYGQGDYGREETLDLFLKYE